MRVVGTKGSASLDLYNNQRVEIYGDRGVAFRHPNHLFREHGELFLDYAAGHPKMPIVGTRSTSGQSKMGANSLHSSYVIPVFAEAYTYLANAPTLDAEKRQKIVRFLKEMGRNVIQHSVEYNNQQAEHFRAYGSVGIATGFWPFAAEAIYGDFGFHEVAEYGYSEDGIAHEGGGYHVAVFHAMNEFAALAYSQGVNLFTARFKRVFTAF